MISPRLNQLLKTPHPPASAGSWAPTCRKRVERLGVAKTPDARATCEDCGGLLRPDVVWFGEMLPGQILLTSQHAAETCDLFFTMGTSAAVHPAAGLPLIAKDAGAYVVEINPQATEISGNMDEIFRGPSAEIPPWILTASGL
ncbi:MAG: hypothetical protein KF799_13440 [Bdellovibrionales bacterium]|nr:hypothetical protein [Bdellovibrionales bacterium]